jgi:hypothetical protein
MPKLLLNCDQVFDVLTRGPFPTGDASDAAVEHHLRACHDCRTLAEALQPAVELLHETIAPAEATGLPEYQGVLARLDRSVATAEFAGRDLARPAPLSRKGVAEARLPTLTPAQVQTARPSSLATYARFTAALVLLVALGSLTWGVLTTAQSPSAHRGRTPVRLDREGLVTLAALDLRSACFPRELLPQPGSASSAAPPAINQEALRCCTECHNTANPARAVLGSVVTFQRSCSACHSL